jgi:hypothetical protein
MLLLTVGAVGICIYACIYIYKPVAVTERSEVWTVFDRSEAVIAASNPALDMDV